MYFYFEEEGIKNNLFLDNIVSFSSNSIKRLYNILSSKKIDISDCENFYIKMFDGEFVYSSKVKFLKRFDPNLITLQNIEDILNFEYPNTNKICFKFNDIIAQTESYIVVALAFRCVKMDVFKNEKYISFNRIEDKTCNIEIVEMDPNGYKVDYAEQIIKYLNYYEKEINKIDEMKKEKNQIDLNLLRSYGKAFLGVVKDNKDILIPIKGKYKKLKSFKFDFYMAAKNNGEEEQLLDLVMQNCSMRKLSTEDNEVYLNILKNKYDLDLPKNNTLLLISCDETWQREEVLKNLLDSNTLKSDISYDVAGEQIRLGRIKNAIDDILSENVENKKIVETISTGKPLKNLNNYEKNEKYCKELIKRNPVLIGNEEQIATIDKIVQMRANSTDILLVQGPPGTGKTELITALCNELDLLKQTVLISSNVQVACNNIVERVKNNKETIIKRYENIYNYKYELEVLKNKKNYVVNQTFNKYKVKNKAVLSKEDLNKEKETLSSVIQLKNNLIAENENFNKVLKDYFSLLTEKKGLELQQMQDEQLKDNIEEQLKELYQKELLQVLKLIKFNKELKTENKELEKFVNNLNQEQLKHNNLINTESDLEDIINGLTQKQEDTEKLLENKDKLDENYRKEIEFCDKMLKKANLLTKETIFNDIMDFFEKPRIIPGKLVEVNSKIKEVLLGFKLLRNILLQDTYLERGVTVIPNRNVCNILKREFNNLYFENYRDKESFKIFIKYFTDLSIFDKFLIKVLNLKVKNIDKHQIKNAITDVVFVCNKMLRNFGEYIENIIDEYFNEELLQTFKKSKQQAFQNAEKEYEEFLLNVNSSSKLIYDIKQQIKQNQKDLKKYKSEELKINTEIDSLNQEVVKKTRVVEKIKSTILSIENEKSLLVSDIYLKNEQLKKIEKTMLENVNRFEEIERKIKQEQLLHYNTINKFDEFKINYDQKLKEYEKEIAQRQQSINFIDGCLDYINEDILFNYLQELEDVEKIENEEIENTKKYFEGYIDSFDSEFRLEESNWKGSTISMTTNQIAKLFKNNNDIVFDYAIIDEASKCSFEDLVIILPKIKKLVLIGDYMQLEPVFEEFDKLDNETQEIFEYSEKFWIDLNRSSFNLLLSKLIEDNEKNNIKGFDKSNCVGIMKKQYRMNKGIFDIVSPVYSIHEGFEIIDMKNTTAKDVICFNIEGDEEPKDNNEDSSKYNEAEIDFIQKILKYIEDNQAALSSIKSIGIITGYSNQVRKIKNTMSKFPEGAFKSKNIECGTFDRFQGREYDLVVVSMVRTERLGFLKEVRRINVAMSRAKKHLIIIGNFDKLKQITKQYKPNNLFKQKNNEEKFVCEVLVPKLASLCAEYTSDKDRIDEIGKAILGG